MKANVIGKSIQKRNLSVAANILKQINSKLGGDLYNLRLAKGLSSRTMLIGLDVCHQGQNSIVGFCATSNDKLSQYYSKKLLQQKGQEIVDKNLGQAFKEAIDVFKEKHSSKNYPDHFIIYRDGVGDAMRRQVIEAEVSQFQEIIHSLYNKTTSKPKLTLIIVNKRINQRFFMEYDDGEILNPPSGLVIDSKVVESENSDIEYDFYLVPQFAS